MAGSAVMNRTYIYTVLIKYDMAGLNIPNVRYYTSKSQGYTFTFKRYNLDTGLVYHGDCYHLGVL